MSKIVGTKLISKYHDNLLTGHFGIHKTQKLIDQKYYLSTLRANVNLYIKR